MQTLNYMDYTAEQITDLMFDRSKFRADRQVCMKHEMSYYCPASKSDSDFMICLQSYQVLIIDRSRVY